jgi:hydroxypyruvate isomerase
LCGRQGWGLHPSSCSSLTIRPSKSRSRSRDDEQSTVKGPDGKDLGGITRAFNRKEHHDLLVPAYESHIGAVADAGFKNLICFSGNREGLDDETGLKNYAEGIQRLIPLCEKKGVILCMELLNRPRESSRLYVRDHSLGARAL